LVRFLLNNKEHTVGDVNPNTSVLDYLREELDRVGTKEGCASGDCGACTVVLGELAGEAIKYSAINACITPVGNLHGKQLITVEDLKNEDRLHPVQQAMVDCHGSQCGFCTPGFVMSMFAYRKSNDQPEHESIIEALGGNLCRCTGYRPIVDAAIQMYEPGSVDQFSSAEAETVTALRGIADAGESVELSGAGKRYYAPSSADELATLLATHPDATLVAGGTDLCLEITQFLREFDTLVYTGRVKELLQVRETEDTIEIGAAVNYSDSKAILCREYPDLQELIERLGSRQIRNQGTLGGNVGNASPIGDMPPALIALNAQLVLRSARGSRTIPVEDYFISYKVTAQQAGEFIESIVVPRAKAGYTFRAYKVSKRLEDDISAVCGVFHINIDNGLVVDASIAFGGMAEIPRRARLCEQALINQPWDQDTVDRAMTALGNDYTPIDDFRASAHYRKEVSQNLLQRLFLETAASPAQVRVTHYA
jgi:xanthine dehydrogenase small subunit